ncbi:hypothetical protein N7530_001676 [Penicillium desertorum]|uniref:FAD dependent oxidoreductase domain-containing protein n=1 Tax=Penicillium desertorum TaxID=1303715 RepID=A0A9W9XB78_9EURO|nr:hypothetical protein N7530_001676 [Penicillium desertorum]
MQEQVTYFKPTDRPVWEPGRFPVWIWAGDPCFYGFPSFGEPTIKVARDTSNNFMTPEQRTYVHSQQLLEQLCSFMGDFMPDKGRQPLRTITCQYSITPDRQFIISPLKNNQDVIVGLGAAHAFKLRRRLVVLLQSWQLMGRARRIFRNLGFRIMLLLLANFRI